MSNGLVHPPHQRAGPAEGGSLADWFDSATSLMAPTMVDLLASGLSIKSTPA